MAVLTATCVALPMSFAFSRADFIKHPRRVGIFWSSRLPVFSVLLRRVREINQITDMRVRIRDRLRI